MSKPNTEAALTSKPQANSWPLRARAFLPEQEPSRLGSQAPYLQPSFLWCSGKALWPVFLVAVPPVLLLPLPRAAPRPQLPGMSLSLKGTHWWPRGLLPLVLLGLCLRAAHTPSLGFSSLISEMV